MARHDIHGRKLQIEQISHTNQADVNAKVIADRIISYDGPKTMGQYDLTYREFVEQLISSYINPGPTYTLDPSTPNTGALSYLNSTYPDANPGDQVYKISAGTRRTWTCYAAGAWSRIDEVIET